FLSSTLPPPSSPPFPYTTLFRSQNDVLETHLRDRLSYMIGLPRIDIASGVTGSDRAKATTAGTCVPQKHDRGGSLAPTFSHVGAAGLFTDRVQIQLSKCLLQLSVLLASGSLHFEPRRFPIVMNHIQSIRPLHLGGFVQIGQRADLRGERGCIHSKNLMSQGGRRDKELIQSRQSDV